MSIESRKSEGESERQSHREFFSDCYESCVIASCPRALLCSILLGLIFLYCVELFRVVLRDVVRGAFQLLVPFSFVIFLCDIDEARGCER
jgi:hypothetical protein